MKYLDLDGLKHYTQTLTNKFKNKFISTSDKGKANGVASLDKTGTVPLSQIPNLDNKYVYSFDGRISSSYSEMYGGYQLTISGRPNIIGSAGVLIIERTDKEDSNTTISLKGRDGSINAIVGKFNSVETGGIKSNSNPNNNEVWTTNGGKINMMQIISNSAIYVYGDIIDSTEGNINDTDVIDNPDSIVFDKESSLFFARKNGNYYSHWTCNSEINISNPDRYGIVDNENDIVKPFANQMYKFTNSDIVYVFDPNSGNMEPLTFN